ncbi:MAG TPA: sigma factor-like helix-turn-helix DNA-binding protein [Verrucomicrobiae bacterium]|nr:sigma factor-like helix-turn-helix DNA-binding protein [Verrucomicrobiae bacterium]
MTPWTRLSATDREFVMIRFFGNRSHKDVAAALAVSEEAARKRISRAIERMRATFARRGIVVPSATLVAAFAAHGAQAAPADVASSWASVAMAKVAAGTGTTSAGGIRALVTTAKVPNSIVAAFGLVVVGVVAFAIFKFIPHVPQAAAPLAKNVAMSVRTPDASDSLTGSVEAFKTAGNAETKAVSAAALDKVKAALHDPNPTALFPDSVMREAIDGLGDKKTAALPILEEALNDADAQIRARGDGRHWHVRLRGQRSGSPSD